MATRPPGEPLGPVSAAGRLLLLWIFTGILIPPVALFCFLTARLFSGSLVGPVARLWGRTVLALLGVRLVIDRPEVLRERRARIVLINHASTLDMPILGALFPPGAMALGKRELLYIPFIGLAWWALGMPLVDRSNRERARASIAAIAARLVADRRTVVIAPEGTRSRDGRLGPFKMGAFHLALASRAPIVPVAIHGAADALPLGCWRVRPGAIRITVGDEIATDDWSEEELRDRADEVRRRMAATLGQQLL